MRQIAQVLKSNGADGELVLGFRDIAPEDIDIKEPVFIYYDGLPVPFFIETFSLRGTSKALVRLTDIEGAEDAMEVTGRKVYVSDEAFEGLYEEEGLSLLEGWILYDEKEKEIGTISGFLDIPGNPCLEVSTCSGDIIVPVHDDLIISLNEDSRTIAMAVPEGLLS